MSAATASPFGYDVFRALVRRHSGLLLTQNMRALVASRLRPLARKLGYTSIATIVRHMQDGDAALTAEVVESLTCSETSFFRDREVFQHVHSDILPRLLQARRDRRSLRLWCAGSSTGQEPYSLAMCLDEGRLTDWRIEILATDLSRAALERSRNGIFSQSEVQLGLPIRKLLAHFSKVGDEWQIDPALRARLSHRRINLIEDVSHLGTFDVIFCRNVLSFLAPDMRKDVVARLGRALAPDGALIVGLNETALGLAPHFVEEPVHLGTYRPAAPHRRDTSPVVIPFPMQSSRPRDLERLWRLI